MYQIFTKLWPILIKILPKLYALKGFHTRIKKTALKIDLKKNDLNAENLEKNCLASHSLSFGEMLLETTCNSPKSQYICKFALCS